MTFVFDNQYICIILQALSYTEVFDMIHKMQLKKPRRQYLREKPSGSNDKEDNEEISAQIVDSATNMSIVKVEKIGDSTPLQDFEAMMSRRDSPEWINKAISGMKNKTFDLVENSCDGDNYPKALEYLLALRKGCIIEQVRYSLSVPYFHARE